MGTKTFTTMVQFQAMIEPMITKALMSTSRILVEKLRESIDTQYYSDPEFYPNIYKRTFRFLDSASYQLIGKNMAEIFVDTDSMSYYNGFDPDKVVEFAGQSQHGSELYQTSTEDFWTTFENFCEDNALKILRNELQKQGLKLI
jgi:hypothetical protein